MNKKYCLLVIGCFLCLQGWSQLKDGTSVLYKYNDLFLQITINGEKKKLPDRYCRMVFTDSLSFTYRYNEANKDPFRAKTVFGAFPGIATFYAVSNHNRITVVEKKRKIYQTTDTTQFYKWELFDDTKIVAGFLCRSALTFRNQKDSVIAWYTTEIPGSFGPGWFTGLPGIVLELQDNHTGDRFTAIKVEPLQLEIRLPENAITVKDLHRLK